MDETNKNINELNNLNFEIKNIINNATTFAGSSDSYFDN